MDIKDVLAKHKLWVNGDRNGIRANLSGADLDFSVINLSCKDLGTYIDEKQAIQRLYHLLYNVKFSKNISSEFKNLLLTQDLIDVANKFHRVDECGVIKNEV